MNPLILDRILKNLPDHLAVTSDEKEALRKCGVALNLDLINNLNDVWQSMLRAKTWEEFIELRGVYKGLQTVIELPEQLSIWIGTPNDKTDYESVEKTLKGLKDGPAT